MKTILVRLISRIGGDWRTALAVALVAITSCATNVNAQSPTGVWDCVLSGHRTGTAYLQFIDPTNNNSPGVLFITEVMVPKPTNTNTDTSQGGGGRGDTGGRGDGGGSGFVPSEQIFGYQTTNGFWSFDAKGRIIGFFVETSLQHNCKPIAIPFFTNAEPPSDTIIIETNGNPASDDTFCVTLPTATNDLGGGLTNFSEQTICYTNAFECSALTNAISFVGTVVPGKRLTLKASSPFGDTTYKGVPAVLLTDISGGYSGVLNKDGVSYLEFFTMSNSAVFPNVYDVSLSGPGYNYVGLAVLSSQKRISFGLSRIPTIFTNEITQVRAVSGPFNSTRFTSQTKGLDQEDGFFTRPVLFNTQPIP